MLPVDHGLEEEKKEPRAFFFKVLPKRVFQRNIWFLKVKVPVTRSSEEPTTVRMQSKNGPCPGNGGAAAGSFRED